MTDNKDAIIAALMQQLESERAKVAQAELTRRLLISKCNGLQRMACKAMTENASLTARLAAKEKGIEVPLSVELRAN